MRIFDTEGDDGDSADRPVGFLKSPVAHPLLHKFEVGDCLGVFDGLKRKGFVKKSPKKEDRGWRGISEKGKRGACLRRKNL